MPATCEELSEATMDGASVLTLPVLIASSWPTDRVRTCVDVSALN